MLFVKTYSQLLNGSLYPSRHSLLDVIPVYVLLLPAYIGMGSLYQKLASKASTKISALLTFSPLDAILIWFLVGASLFFVPIFLRHFLRANESSRLDPLSVGLAILLLVHPLSEISKAEVRSAGNFLHLVDDSRHGVLSLDSKKVIPPGSIVASTWAGTIPYYRPDVDFVDPLGKMDSYIAKSLPRGLFHPGHSKWDWQYTLSRYKPDFIRGDLSSLRKWDPSAEWDNYLQLSAQWIKRKSN